MKKYIFFGIVILFGLGILAFVQYVSYHDGKLHIVFCDVGQGDGIFIRSPKGTTILIDGGPDKKILSCLEKQLPFWERTIDIAILTHPHVDHYVGFLDVFQQYTIKQFVTENLNNPTGGYTHFKKIVKDQQIPTSYVLAGDKIKTKDGVVLTIVGPTKDFLDSTSPNGEIGESKEFASIETFLQFNGFTALFTGDSQTTELATAIATTSHVSVVQAAHHGSQYGFDESIYATLSPNVVVISVGKNNRYGHPAPTLISLLQDKNIKTLRTDQVGSVEVITNGKSFSIH